MIVKLLGWIKMRGVLIILTAFLAVSGQAAKQAVESLAAGRCRGQTDWPSEGEEIPPCECHLSDWGDSATSDCHEYTTRTFQCSSAGHMKCLVITIFCLANSQRYQDEYRQLLDTVDDKSGLEAIRNLHQQLDDDNDGTIEPSETTDFIKADLQVSHAHVWVFTKVSFNWHVNWLHVAIWHGVSKIIHFGDC